MIGAIKGSVGLLAADYCILDTAGGVGYRVFMPANQLAQLNLGQEVRVQVHTAVREDAIILYGFLTQEAYALFELLLTVSGVGPKMALGILAAVKPEAFYLAVQSKDAKALVKLPGGGKKTAERMRTLYNQGSSSSGSISHPAPEPRHREKYIREER